MAWLHRVHLVCHPTQNDISDPGLRVVFPDPGLRVGFPGRTFSTPCVSRALRGTASRKAAGRRAAGRPSLFERAERASFDGRPLKKQSLQPERGPPGRLFGVPFFGRSKKGTPGPVTARYAGRPNAFRAHPGRAVGRLIGAFQRSTLRSGSASLAMERDPSLFGIADMCSDSRVIRGTTSETLPLTLY